ncbi:MAG TPA: mechanosensitive ion channel domain-containing protein [Longimicrobiales bacterium]
MTTSDILVAVLAIALAALLIAAAAWLLRRSAAVLPFPSQSRSSVRRWLPVAQLVSALLIAVVITVLTAGPAPAAILAGVSAGIILVSAWFFVRDIIAGIVLRAEHGFATDQMVHLGDHSGRITAIGARSLEVETADGRRVRLPWGRLGSLPLGVSTTHDTGGALRLTITVPRDGTAESGIAAIRHAALHAFFVSPVREPIVRLLGEEADTRSYEVTVHAVDPAYRPAIEEAVRMRLGRGRRALDTTP